MKQFYETNTVTYNLMSFTGFKSIYIFSLLVEGPKSYQELQDSLLNHEYLREKASVDTLRIYLNSLREIGCKIKRCTVNRVTKYYIESHPFILNFNEEQINSLIKIYKIISKSIEVNDLILLHQFFLKISEYINDEELIANLEKISPLYNIDKKLLEDLIKYAENNNEIVIYYNSNNSGEKYITLLVDKLEINDGKLYVYGVNSEYQNYGSFLVSNILKITGVNLNNQTLAVPTIVVGYEYKKEKGENFEPLSYEKIIKTNGNKLLVEMTSKNKFEMMQRVLYHANKCKVLYPEDFKNYITNNLRKMKEGYLEKKC